MMNRGEVKKRRKKKERKEKERRKKKKEEGECRKVKGDKRSYAKRSYADWEKKEQRLSSFLLFLTGHTLAIHAIL